MKRLVTVLVFFSFFHLAAQDGHERCVTHVLHEQQINDGKAIPHNQFENWLQHAIQQRKARQDKNDHPEILSITSATYTIPVVVHVIHDGEAIGSGSNISMAQIASQIRIFNEDFRRELGTNGYNTHPDGADTEIEFCLAQTDPWGCPTDGVVRVQGSKSPWVALSDDFELKSHSFWDPEKYMNVWVTALAGGVLGYAQFPDASGLPGIPAGSKLAQTDGVVINHLAFGDEGSAQAPFNLGRTATHEVGHWLGLRHPWGDGGCSVDDFCGDTPNASGPYWSEYDVCDNPGNQCGDGVRMIENYMDYSDDGCMNIFTQCQKQRMITVLENSPRRKELLTSAACDPPPPLLENNAALNKLYNPAVLACEGILSSLSFELRNVGANDVTTVGMAYDLNGGAPETINWTGNLAGGNCGTAATITLSDMPVGTGENTLRVYIETTNGGTDNEPDNDTITFVIDVMVPKELPVREDFEGIFPPAGWDIVNPDGSYTWEPIMIDNNQVAFMNFWDYESFGEEDDLVSPSVDLSGHDIVYMMFKVAHARYAGGSNDGLRVSLSEDCKETWETIYDKSGADLETTSPKADFWVPTQPSDWRTEVILLSSYNNVSDAIIQFTGITDWGNNLFIDDVEIVGMSSADGAILITELMTSDILSCAPELSDASFNLFNLGEDDIVSFDIVYRLNSEGYQTVNWTGNIPGGAPTPASVTLVLPDIPASAGENTLEVHIENINGNADAGSIDTLQNSFSVVVSQELPYLEGFQEFFPPTGWQVINPDDDITWQQAVAGGSGSGNLAAMMNFYDYEDAGQEDHLISSPMDLEELGTAYLTFNVSYRRYDATTHDGLRVDVSNNCGDSWQNIYAKWGSELQTRAPSTAFWTPNTPSDWRTEILSLSAYAGDTSVLIRFTGITDWGNNLYIDDVKIAGMPSANGSILINELMTPDVLSCNPTQSDASFNLFNMGEDDIVSFDIVYRLNNEGYQTVNWTGNIPGGAPTPASVTLVLPDIPASAGENVLEVHIENINGNADAGSIDTLQNSFSVVIPQGLPYLENFQGFFPPTGWQIINPDEAITWEQADAGDPGNLAAMMNFYDYEDAGQEDHLISSPMDLEELGTAYLTFNVSYRRYDASTHDGLRVDISNDCGDSWQNVYSKWGHSLQTRPPSTEFWIPGSSPDDWRTEVLNLSAYAGDTNVLVRFTGITNWGNNLYIDDVELHENEPIILSTDTNIAHRATVSVYPNPSDGELHFDIRTENAASYQIRIVDMLGREVYVSESLHASAPVVRLTGQQPGLYLVNIYFDDYMISRKVVIR